MSRMSTGPKMAPRGRVMAELLAAQGKESAAVTREVHEQGEALAYACQ